jgi:Bacterial tandem repeat domain 1
MFHSIIRCVTTYVPNSATAPAPKKLLRQTAMALGLSVSLVGPIGLAGTANAADHYAATWEKSSGSAWIAQHGLSADAYQLEFDRLVGQGYRLRRVSGYMVGDKDHYAAIWEKSSGPVWVARHGLTPAAYQQEFDKLVGQGYRLIHISGYGTMTQSYFAAIWEKSDGPGWVARHGLNETGFQKAFDEYTSKGFRLKQVSVYQFLGRDRYAAIWEKSGGEAGATSHGLTPNGYEEEFDKLVGQGYRLTDVGND